MVFFVVVFAFVFGLSLFVAVFVFFFLVLVPFSFFTAAAATVSDDAVDRVRRCLFFEAAGGVGSDDGDDDDDKDKDDDDRDANRGAFAVAATAACTPRSLALRRRVVEATVFVTMAEDNRDNMHVVVTTKSSNKIFRFL